MKQYSSIVSFRKIMTAMQGGTRIQTEEENTGYAAVLSLVCCNAHWFCFLDSRVKFRSPAGMLYCIHDSKKVDDKISSYFCKPKTLVRGAL